MQPKGRCQYVFSPALDRWIPWEGTSVGFGGVTLFTLDGEALGTHRTGETYSSNATPGLDANASDYGVFGSDNVPRVNLRGDIDAQTTGSSTGQLAGVGARLQAFNGTAYDRVRSFVGTADAIVAPTLGLLGSANFPLGFNGTTFDRMRSVANNADALAVLTLGTLAVSSFLRAFNGTSYDRVRTNSAATLASATQPFAMLCAAPGEWSINHTPAADTQATITRAAGAAGVRHVCRSISATLIGLAAAAETTVLINLRDGATGAGTILWSTRLLVTGTTGSETGITLSNLNIVGSAATAMTLEFAAAGGANTFESVALSGYDSI